jgi:hypothetical protein
VLEGAWVADMRTLAQAAAFGRVVAQYQHLRAAHPAMRAPAIFRYIRANDGLAPGTVRVRVTERGHEWSYTGSAYGGDNESHFGKGRCYCGADGDA